MILSNLSDSHLIEALHPSFKSVFDYIKKNDLSKVPTGRVTLDADNAGRFLSGLRRRGPWPNAAQVAVYGDRPAALLGTAHVQAGELIPGRLLSPIEIQQILELQT